MASRDTDKKKQRKGPVEVFWELMDSMKFAVGLLIVLTIVSLIGVLLPQFPPSGFAGTLQDLYIQKYGELVGTLMLMLGLDHVFTVWWYYLLLLLLCTNILVCSFRRFGHIMNLIRRESYFETEEKFREQKNNRSVKLAEDPDTAAGRIEGLLREGGYKVSTRQDGEKRLLYGKRGAVSQIGPFLSHIAMVLIFLGAAVSYLLSFEHFQWMGQDDVIEVPNLDYMARPGYQAALFVRRLAGIFGIEMEPDREMIYDQVIRRRDWRNLPDDLPVDIQMKVRLEKFEAQFTPQGKPKAYLSTVTVIDPESGEDQFSHLIKVNDPLIHEGVYFYQSSYSPGGGGAQWVDLRVLSPDTADPLELTVRAKPGGPAVALGNTGDSLRVERFVGSFRIGDDGQVNSAPGQENNPAVQIEILRGGEQIHQQWIFQNFPNFSHQAGGPYTVTMADYGKSYLTGLTIRTHRSQAVIWLGFALMVVGVLLSFYINHRQFWVMVLPHGDGARAWVSGVSYKWKQPFRKEFAGVCDKIAGKQDSRDNADRSPVTR